MQIQFAAWHSCRWKLLKRTTTTKSRRSEYDIHSLQTKVNSHKTVSIAVPPPCTRFVLWVQTFLIRVLLNVAPCVRPPCALSFMLCCCIFFLWPHPGRPKPPAHCAPLAGKRSRFSDDQTWGERCWSSICPRRKTESWTAKPVKQRQAEL